MAIEFSTSKDFPKPDDVKKKGDTHRYLADLECLDDDIDGKMKWRLIALDGVKMPVDEDESDDGDLDEYDTSEDEPSEDSPKTAKDAAMVILAPPKQ